LEIVPDSSQFPTSSVATRPPADPPRPCARPPPSVSRADESPGIAPADARRRPSPLCTDASPDLASARARNWFLPCATQPLPTLVGAPCPPPDPAVRNHSPPPRPQVDRRFDPELRHWSYTCRIVSTGPMDLGFCGCSILRVYLWRFATLHKVCESCGGLTPSRSCGPG
ncbi:unnamed protein product, partial [Urochloa humidicola]